MRKIRFIPVPEFIVTNVDHRVYAAPAEGANDASGVYYSAEEVDSFLEELERQITENFQKYISLPYQKCNEHYRLAHFKQAIGLSGREFYQNEEK